ncbi:MAG: KEOPS complex subunit Pcc1 [Candidatus Woesearchaeota archaeon]
MVYYSLIRISDKGGNIYSCIAPEKIDKKRSTFKIKKTKNNIFFEIRAKDAVAFRATTNMITQMLVVFEKIKNLKNFENKN